MLAAQNGHDLCTHALLEAEAAVDQTEGDGWTALMCAVLNAHNLCARALIDAGARLDIKNSSGDTALSLVQKGMAGAHLGIFCDRSGMQPIVGNRYTLNGEDLCEAEFQKLSPQEQHHWACIPPLTPSNNLRAMAALLGS
jgi:hypothetical protein